MRVSLLRNPQPSSKPRHRNNKVFAPVNLDRIQHWIDQGRLTSSPEKPITAKELLESGCVHNVHDGIKLLGSVSVPVQYVTSNAQSISSGLGIPEDCHPHHSLASVAQCYPCCREGGRKCFLPVLQRPCSQGLCKGQDRPDGCCAYTEDRYSCVSLLYMLKLH